jgi:hypothetical protein
MLCVWVLSSIPKNFQQLSVPWLTENKQRNHVYWPSTLLVMYHSFLLFFCIEDIGSRFLWNYFVFIPDHTASLPGRPPWECQILHLFHLRRYSTNFYKIWYQWHKLNIFRVFNFLLFSSQFTHQAVFIFVDRPIFKVVGEVCIEITIERASESCFLSNSSRFPKAFAFWNVPRLYPFAPLVIATCR